MVVNRCFVDNRKNATCGDIWYLLGHTLRNVVFASLRENWNLSAKILLFPLCRIQERPLNLSHGSDDKGHGTADDSNHFIHRQNI